MLAPGDVGFVASAFVKKDSLLCFLHISFKTKYLIMLLVFENFFLRSIKLKILRKSFLILPLAFFLFFF